VPKNSAQKRVQAKREAEKAARRRQERTRKIRIGVGIVAAVGLAFLLFSLFRGGDTNPLGASPTPTPSASPSVNPGCSATKPGAYRGKQYKSLPAYRVNPEKKYTATMETSCGQVIIELLPKSAPKTVSNFVYLARQSFFDGLMFHRVIPDFMIQGGDPAGTGSGGPGYQFDDEIDKTLTFDKLGLLAMANAGKTPDGKGTNGSQFFITIGTPTHLNGKHTIFGRVLKGLDIVTKIVGVQRDAQDKPLVPVYILKVTITET
jgi:cyclophilin family peptidyl-prolyl cis-trans isomerase